MEESNKVILTTKTMLILQLLEQSRGQEDKELERVTRILCSRALFFIHYVLSNFSSENDSEYIKCYHLKGSPTNSTNNEIDDTEHNETSLLGKTTNASYGTTTLPQTVTIDWKDKAHEGNVFYHRYLIYGRLSFQKVEFS